VQRPDLLMQRSILPTANDSPADLYDHYLCLGRTDLYSYRSFLAGSGGGQDALLAGSVGIDLMATLNSDIDPGGMTSNG